MHVGLLQPATLGATVPRSSRVAAAPPLSASTRQMRLSAAVQRQTVASGGSSEVGDQALRAFKEQLAERLRSQNSLQGACPCSAGCGCRLCNVFKCPTLLQQHA